MLIGVDTGGTFTDCVLWDGRRVVTHKVPSTPDDFSRGVLAGVEDVLANGGVSPSERFDLVQSSTVATNVLLERKGARTALITTKGFRDVLEIGRQNRPELYNFFVERPEPLVPRSLRRELTERVSAEGDVLVSLDPAEIDRVLDLLCRRNIESLAVCLLFSFLRPQHERAVAQAARRRGLSVSASFEVLPEFREHERTSTTVVNAYVAPVVGRYLRRLAGAVKKLGTRHLRIVQSNGGSLSAKAAAARAANTLLSGPAAGVIGAMAVARPALSTGRKGRRAGLRLITFDMGGTSTDVSLVAGDHRVSTETTVGGFPVGVPMMDIHTVGAGGGSLAHVDAGGALHVGPQSAGATPGPACYGLGDQPTVTDANLMLGRIDPARFLGGRMTLDVGRAERAMRSLADALGTDVRAAARAVIRIVNSNMERAIRVISVERGYDPRDFTLVSFGGAGGLHACELAAALRIPRVFIPRHPGVLSAWGAVSADVVKHVSRTVMLSMNAGTPGRLARVFDQLDRQARRDLKREGFNDEDLLQRRSVDIRYVGQAYELNVPFDGPLEGAVRTFHLEHARRYGHSTPDEPVEIVTARVRAVGQLDNPSLDTIPRGGRAPGHAVLASRRGLTTYDRSRLRAGNQLAGPALILEDFATTWLPAGWRGKVDRWGNLILES